MSYRRDAWEQARNIKDMSQEEIARNIDEMMNNDQVRTDREEKIIRSLKVIRNGMNDLIEIANNYKNQKDE